MKLRLWIEPSTRSQAVGLAILLLAAPNGCQPEAERLPDAPSDIRKATLEGDPALPGLGAGDAKVIAALAAALESQGPQYRPRTRHLQPGGRPKYTNRLIFETSPYLLQHAHNPVNWYSWGDDAFERARQESKPVLLSVGYSTCHWCHVMEEESFEDEEIAQYLNRNYIAIKVDREVRPDIDGIYMAAVQRLTGGGGWPMTVWLAPDRKPFFGGTYFPPRDGVRGARVGFLTILRQMRQIFDTEPDRVAQAAGQLFEALRTQLQPAIAGGMPSARVLDQAATFYRARFDSANGGTLGAPKFPSSLPVRFLLRQHRRSQEQVWLRMAERTLEKMAAGGIHDHIGGGFHRYATDAEWLVPHFEKMLYDNALLAMAYLEAYQATGREDFADVARRILRWAERDMSSPEGGFYSASDADSPAPNGLREEGWFFTWTPAELETVLGEKTARVVASYYGVSEAGNFEGRTVLSVPRPVSKVSRDLQIEPRQVRSILDQARTQLDTTRRSRPGPLRDEKILAAWNGLMISAFARAGFVLGSPGEIARARRAAEFVLERMVRDDRLLRTYGNGQASHDAYLDDYACVIAGCLDLYEASGELRWLEEALRLDGVLEKHYEDPAGGFFLTSDDHEQLLAREKPSYDGAEPSANSVQAMNLLRLHELTTSDRFRERADRLFVAFGGGLGSRPAALSEMLLAVDFRLDTPKEIVIVTPGQRSAATPFLDELRRAFLPNRVLIVASATDSRGPHEKLVPLLESKVAQAGRTTAYVCEQRVCELPTSDPGVFGQQIRRNR